MARGLVSPLAEANDVELVEETLRPRPPYPFPWPLWRFLDAMPETVLLEAPTLEPLAVRAEEHFDLVVLAYQVWYLAPSGPMAAFLKSESGRRLLRSVADRLQWENALAEARRRAQEALVGQLSATGRAA